MAFRKTLAFVLATALPVTAQNPQRHAMVVSIQHDASDAGLQILRQGGNAADAAVTVGFALAVTLPNAGNLGGGGFMLLRDHSGEAHFLDFRERAPMAATADMYLDAKGDVIPDLSTLGYKAIGVPGSVAGLVYAQSHFGKLTLAEDMAPAIKLATSGYVLNPEEASYLLASSLGKFPESRRIFQRSGNYYKAGETFKQPDLARTLTTISQHPADFYVGAIARQLANFIQSHGGLISEADLAAYRVVDRQPLIGHFTAHGKQYDIVTSPPPSSGGIALLETLGMLSHFDLTAAGADRSPGQVHLITEAFRRAYKDRTDYLGDPDYTPIPTAQMEQPAYAAAWAKMIDPLKATPSTALVRPPGFLPPAPSHSIQSRLPPTETTHYSIVDEDGNAVAVTYTLNDLFGSGVTAVGLGFLLNDEMDDFSSKPSTPNMFGLIQGPANAIAPGHRPLSSMTPTIVTTHAEGKPGELRLVLGSPGGATIITTVANDLISILVNDLTIQQAADAPRFHQQYLPDTLDVEKRFDIGTIASLTRMGYRVNRKNAADEGKPGVWGDSELISIDPKTHVLTGGHDSRHTFGSIASY